MPTSEIILQILKYCNQIIWGAPMLFILMGTHLFFTFRLRFVQRHVFRGIKLSLKNDSSGEGDVSGSASLATTLAATLGVGNIVGVSTAIAFGGPGALLWCWLTGILGMATSYAECYLSMHYRQKQKDGSYLGGPMYVLEKGLHNKILAVLFACCTLIASLGVGCSMQSSSIAAALKETFHLSPTITGFLVAIPIGFILLGGIQSIGNICIKLVPAMGIFYIGGCFLLILTHIHYLPEAISLIVRSAFIPKAAAGGFIGSTLMTAARFGVARGLFTNEAGLGSAPIAAASAKTTSKINQSLISMTAAFWDTVVLCAVTGIAVVMVIMKNPSITNGLLSTEYTAAAFEELPFLGRPMLNLSLVLFAFATILGWSYFGEKSFLYLSHGKYLKLFQIVYIVMVFLGCAVSLDLVWELSDFVNAFMAVPNLIGILALNKIIPRKINES